MFKISASSQVRNNFFLNQKNNTVFFEYLLLATFYVVKETTIKIYTLATFLQQMWETSLKAFRSGS